MTIGGEVFIAAKILDGKQIVKNYRRGLQDQVEALEEKGLIPKLSIMLVDNDGTSQSYIRLKKEAAEKIGMISEIVHLEETATEEKVLDEPNRLSNDGSISSTLVRVSLPKQVSKQKILKAINPERDAGGFHPINIGKLYADEQTFVSCTPLGIMETLERANIDLESKNAVVIGRSHIVGQSVSKLLLQKNALVAVLHSRLRGMASYLRDADVIVSAIGKPGLMTKDVVKEGAVIIDVSNIPNENGKLKDDIDYNAVKETAGVITPVPGGVGLLTVTIVSNNILLAERMRRGIGS